MRNKQGITIVALIVAIIGLSIGFAAFTNTLTISSSATVNPSDENFIVQFSLNSFERVTIIGYDSKTAEQKAALTGNNQFGSYSGTYYSSVE